MFRKVKFVFFVALLFPASVCLADNWASQLFNKPTHDFGTVARGAKTEHLFTFTNNLQSEIQISSVRASCGCTTPSIVTQIVKPGEEGAIRAKFNTLSFLGQRGATVTVQFSRPAFAEVQLRVDGYVRKDIVFTPGEIDWGKVEEGKAVKQTVAIAYAGRGDWKITKVSCGNPSIKLDLVEKSREGQRVNYELNVELQPSAEAGMVNDDIIFETDDRRLRTVPLSMSGEVESKLSVSSKVIYLSNVKKGDVIKHVILLKGENEFQLTGVQSSDPAVKVDISGGKKNKIQRLTVTIDASDKTKDFTSEIVVSTDLDGLSRTIKVECNMVK